MAAGISHEIRNPMTTVRGFLQVLSRKKDNALYQSYYQLMVEELDRANAIITEFLTMGRNKRSTKRVQPLNDIILAMLPLLQADAASQDKIVKAELQDTPCLMLDEKEMRQVILNLVRNGLEAMAKNGVVTIKTFETCQAVVMSIQDQGSGIPQQYKNQLGNPFFTTKEGGTGLGLGIWYSIAERHKAKIDFATGPDGTTFFVRFNKMDHVLTESVG